MSVLQNTHPQKIITIMDIALHTITVRELLDGFANNDDEGVVGYHGRLNIRPPYQREFVYSERQQIEVINSIFKGFPLNVMYWVRNGEDSYELLDGQQRTLSICSFHAGEFFIEIDGNPYGYSNLKPDQKEQFLGYQLQIYICENGTDKEQLDWFRIINIAGEKLSQQELRNAVYTGQWVTDAKRKFSKKGCVAYKLGEKYMSGSPIRQDYLETVLRWISRGDIETYMAKHQHDKNADREWQYYQQVMSWVMMLFTTYRREMKGVAWGDLYNRFHEREQLSSDLEREIARLMIDDDVTNKRGIYEYVLSGEERCLSIRAFSDKMKRSAYERQQGICPRCGNHFDISEMEADHITPWSQGGPTTAENCQMLCRDCNRKKSDK